MPLLRCIASRYTECITQLVTRVDDDLAARIDQLIAEGVVDSRSDAVRRGLRGLIEHHRRRLTGEAIVRGYVDLPQSPGEVGWADRASILMIAEEPW